MIHQFLYARKNAGYCQINAKEELPYPKSEMLKLETLKSYIVADGLTMKDLPQAYYFYSDEIAHQNVGIVGKTTFVPKGTSEESGDRDTSFLHKYIFDDESVNELMKQPSLIFRERFYCETVEEYKQKEDFVEDSGLDVLADRTKLYEVFHLNDEKMKLFLYCCLDCFSDVNKRVYCYLPSNDRSGSEYAKQLMQLILTSIPNCILASAGFLTYSLTYHNASTNPIPGYISVVFLPKNEDTKFQETSESSRNYIFDFVEERFPKIGEINETVAFMINRIMQKMQNPEDANTNHFYAILDTFFLPFSKVSCQALASVLVIIAYQSKNAEWKDAKKRQGIAEAIKSVLQSERFLSERGKEQVYSLIHRFFETMECNRENLICVDTIYSAGMMCQSSIIQELCDYCLNLVKEKQPINKVLMITNYEYAIEDMNDDIIYEIYSQKKYRFLACKLIRKTLEAIKTIAIPNVNKMDKIVGFAKKMYENYPELVTSEGFISEIEDIIGACLSDDSKERLYEVDWVKQLIEENLLGLSEDYVTISRSLCYQMMSSMEVNSSYLYLKRQELGMIQNWINQLFASETEDSLIVKLRKRIISLIFNEVFQKGEVYPILEEMRKYDYEQRLLICNDNFHFMKKIITQYKGDDFDREVYYNLFVIFSYSDIVDITEIVCAAVLKLDGIRGMEELYELILLEHCFYHRRIDECSIARILKKYILSDKAVSRFSDKDVKFLDEFGIRGLTADKDALDSKGHNKKLRRSKEVDE